ncbi:MAG: hypothetical protein AAF789_04305 [Bacteroidota bacterium]
MKQSSSVLLYQGNDDTDTIEVYFPERSQTYSTTFNGKSGEIPFYIPPELGIGRSSYWFQKEIN